MGEETDSPKSRLRRELDVRRQGVAAEDLARASRAVCEQIAQSRRFRGARHVALYAARIGEVDPVALTTTDHGADAPAFYYPRVEGEELVFRRGTALELQPGRFGMPEPAADATALAGDAAAAIILVPGLAFDRRGARLGTGKGYYDRALPKHPSALRIGLALEAFVVDRVPDDPWDVAMDAIATERQFLIVGPRADVHPGDL